jgi:hypothetical protein
VSSFFCKVLKAWEGLKDECGFSGKMRGRQGERREMILAYIDQASRRLTTQKPEKTIQKIR